MAFNQDQAGQLLLSWQEMKDRGCVIGYDLSIRSKMSFGLIPMIYGYASSGTYLVELIYDSNGTLGNGQFAWYACGCANPFEQWFT